MPSCSGASNALGWTTGTGFACNSSITASAVPAANLTGSTLAAGVTASSLTSVGTLSSLAVSGDVGIGTTSASSPLVVNGGIATLADAGGNGFIAVGRSSDNFAWAPLAKQNNNTTYEGGIQWTPAGANITIGTTLATAMTILSSGNVGIGTTSSILHP